MKYFSRVKYKDYIDRHMQIMRQRFMLCEQVMEKLEVYDYEAYNYAWYLVA